MVETLRRDAWSHKTRLDEIRETWVTNQREGWNYGSRPTVLGNRVDHILDGRLKEYGEHADKIKLGN
jgi:hypothetical protein